MKPSFERTRSVGERALERRKAGNTQNQNPEQHRIETRGMIHTLAICRKRNMSRSLLTSVPQSNSNSCSDSDDELASATASVWTASGSVRSKRVSKPAI